MELAAKDLIPPDHARKCLAVGCSEGDVTVVGVGAERVNIVKIAVVRNAFCERAIVQKMSGVPADVWQLLSAGVELAHDAGQETEAFRDAELAPFFKEQLVAQANPTERFLDPWYINNPTNPVGVSIYNGY